MRLTTQQQTVIKTSFSAFFGGQAKLWLFGSRVDDAKRGGDIDLYIETPDTDTAWLMEQRMQWNVHLIKQLGDQKIDIVINQLTHQVDLPIYRVAQRTGILLA